MPYKPNLNPIYLQIFKIRLEEAACLGFLAGSSEERKDKLVINLICGPYVELLIRWGGLNIINLRNKIKMNKTVN